MSGETPDRSTSHAEPSIGLGDTVAKITKRLGIKPCRKCRQRQRRLNRLVRYRNKTLRQFDSETGETKEANAR